MSELYKNNIDQTQPAQNGGIIQARQGILLRFVPKIGNVILAM